MSGCARLGVGTSVLVSLPVEGISSPHASSQPVSHSHRLTNRSIREYGGALQQVQQSLAPSEIHDINRDATGFALSEASARVAALEDPNLHNVGPTRRTTRASSSAAMASFNKRYSTMITAGYSPAIASHFATVAS